MRSTLVSRDKAKNQVALRFPERVDVPIEQRRNRPAPLSPRGVRPDHPGCLTARFRSASHREPNSVARRGESAPDEQGALVALAVQNRRRNWTEGRMERKAPKKRRCRLPLPRLFVPKLILEGVRMPDSTRPLDVREQPIAQTFRIPVTPQAVQRF